MIVEMANANADWAQQQLQPAGGGQVAGGTVAVGNGETMVDVVADLLYANTASNMDNTARQLFALNVHETPLLKEVVDLIFDKATDQPSMHEYDAGLCAALIAMEVSQGTISKYRFTIIDFIKEAMKPAEVDWLIDMKEKELADELDENMKGLLQMELIDLRAQGNRKKLAKFTFFAEICQLDQSVQMQDILEEAILHLLRTLLSSQFMDDEAVECAVGMLYRTGKMLAEAERDHTEMDRVYRALEALPSDNGMRLGNKIGRLLSTRKNGWVPVYADTTSYDAGVREIHREQFNSEIRERNEKENKERKLSLDLGKILDAVDSDHVGQCIDHFLDLRVDAYSQSSLQRVVSTIFDKVAVKPARADLYASICAAQIKNEPEINGGTHRFHDTLIEQAKWLIGAEWREPNVAERELAILTETDEDKRLRMQIELIEITCTARKRKFAAIDFLGRLFLLELIPARIIDDALKELLKTMESRDEAVDEESIRCALQLLQQCGRQLHQETLNGKHPPCFSIHRHFDTLTVGMGRVSKDASDQIKYLKALRANNWSEVAVERNIVDGLMAEEAALVMNNAEEEDEDEAFQDDADWLYDSASDGDEDEDLNQEEAQEALEAEDEREAAEEAALLAAMKAESEAKKAVETQSADGTRKGTKSAEPTPQPSSQTTSDDEKGRSSTSSWSKVDSTDSDV